MSWNVPPVHEVHTVPPDDAWNVPAPQLGQLAAPEAELAVPGEQVAHDVAPRDAWNVPALQLSHEV